MATLSYTLETTFASDPNFPSGYTGQNAAISGGQTFDFGRNWFYWPIYGAPNGGIAITDLSTMEVTRTVTLNQMYAGTPYGLPAGSPPSQNIYDLRCGNNTDLYMLMAGDPSYSPPGEFCRFTRVNPVTMKVTGEWYVSRSFPPPMTCVMPGGWQGGVINTTATHTIVLYPINGALTRGPQIMDGTGMAPIGLGPTPMTEAYNCMFAPAAKHPDGSCDFVMMDPDSWLHPTSGNIDIWRVNVSDSLVVTSTKTGTLNILPYFTPPSTTDRLFVGQIEYDPTHDAFIVTVPDASQGTSTPNGSPSWLLSVNWNGSVNWDTYQPTIGGSQQNNAQYNMTGTTYMAGSSDNLQLYDTSTGALTWSGGILVEGTPAGSYFRVWDASRNAYWTYALSRGFVRIDLVGVGNGSGNGNGSTRSSLALDDVIAIDETHHEVASAQIFLDWSDDRGHRFGSPVGQPIGQTGEYLTVAQWQRLGYARDRILRVTWSVPVRTALQGAFIEVDTNAKS